MRKMPLFAFGIFLSIALSTTSLASVLYKNVQIGPSCFFETPRLWKIKDVLLKLPDETRNIVVRYESKQCIGKEVAVTATFAEYIHAGNIDGGINETISQISSLQGVTQFAYSIEHYNIKKAQSKICSMSYFKNNKKIFIKSIFIIPNDNPNIFYSFSGHYINKYGQEVVDKLFASIFIE